MLQNQSSITTTTDEAKRALDEETRGKGSVSKYSFIYLVFYLIIIISF
jgi:hypothetical protein